MNNQRPTVPVTIDGTEYRLYFDFNAIADTEAMLARQGVIVNLLLAKLLEMTAASTRALFVAGLKVNHPDIGLDRAYELYDLADPMEVIFAIGTGYRDYSPKPKPKQDDEVKLATDPS